MKGSDAEYDALVAAVLAVVVGPWHGKMYLCNFCEQYIISPDEHADDCPIARLQAILYATEYEEAKR